MKKTHLFLFLTLIIGQKAFTQGNDIIIRHLEGRKAVKISQAFLFGNNKSTMTTGLGYNQYFSDRIFADVSLNMEYGAIQDTKVSNFYARLNANYTLLSRNNTIFFNVAGGLFGGIEKVESEILEQDNQLSTFCGGLDLGLTTEIFLTNAICIEPFVYQYFQKKTNLGSSFYNVGLNLKFNF